MQYTFPICPRAARQQIAILYGLRSSLLLAAAFVSGLVLLIPHTSFAAQITITMTDSTFSPQNVTVNAGDTVRWVNNGSMPHSVTADSGAFDSGSIAPGQSFAATFNTGGSYAYHCTFHGGSGGVGMSGKLTILAAAVVNTTSNSTVAPSSADQIAAQAQALLSQISNLEAQLGGKTTATTNVGTGVATNSSSCPLIGRSLKQGLSGDDVLRLQQFLARDTSIYPEGKVTGYYGALTEAAVKRWQVKYNIVSSGSPSSTGYGVVGPRTAAAIALLCTTGSYGGVAGPGGQSTVGGYITVSPISGVAPLTVSVTATVNTPKSCAGAAYTLDFGDNTAVQQIPVAAGNCSQLNQAFPHSYKYSGTYQIKLSAGAHSTSATVTVTGTAAPVFTPGLPRETFSVSPTSGGVPLTVTFAGTVNSNDAGFCAGGCASALDFGDGTMATIDLPASVGGWLDYSVSHTYTKSGGFKATLYQGAAGAGQAIVGTATVIVGATSSGGGGTSYSPPSVAPLGGDSLSFTISFDLPSACTGYQLSWGDGSSDVTQSDGGSSCAQTPLLKSFNHTYGGSGSYTITVRRGPTLSRIDDVALNISN